MNTANSFLSYLDSEQQRLVTSLNSPALIQAFLDETEYPSDDCYRSSVRVLQDRKANCLDGAFFAAACFREIGYLPLIVDLLPEPGTDDDHLLAVYRCHGLWGAVAKSNFSGLRYREPIYRTIRELALSYFEQFFNQNGMKTLRGYTRPYNLSHLDHLQWLNTDEGMEKAEQALYSLKQIPLFSEKTIAEFIAVDPRSLQAGLSGANEAGLYKVK